jgi:hypothetical protein
MIAEGKQKLFEELSQAKARKPFVPFAIVMRNGSRFEVHDRWHVGFSEGSSFVVVLREDQTHAFTVWSDVAAIEMLEPAES